MTLSQASRSSCDHSTCPPEFSQRRVRFKVMWKASPFVGSLLNHCADRLLVGSLFTNTSRVKKQASLMPVNRSIIFVLSIQGLTVDTHHSCEPSDSPDPQAAKPDATATPPTPSVVRTGVDHLSDTSHLALLRQFVTRQPRVNQRYRHVTVVH